MMQRIVMCSLLLLLIGCAIKEESKPRTDEEGEEMIQVSTNDQETLVSLINTEGKLLGHARLSEGDEGVKVSVHVKDLKSGLHGFHIHEKGRCDTPSFESAGGHFNPDKKAHGFNHENGPHAGDLPNLNIKEDTSVKSVYFNDRVTLKRGEPHSLRHEEGTALLIHEKEDDYISQPAGNSGERIACGVISEPSIN